MSACIEITTVSHCKNVCQYCPQSLLLRTYGKKEFMTLDTFNACLSKIPKSVKLLFAGYSESFLNKDAAKMMKIGYDAGYTLFMNTTLVGLREEDVEMLEGVKFESISLHLPDDIGAMKANVDDEYVKNAKLFKEKVGYTSSHVYGPLHHRLYEVFPGTSLRALNNQFLHTRANNVDEEKSGLQHHKKLSGKIQCDVVLRRPDGNTALNFNVLLPNGDVTLCCMDYGLKHKLGNLVTETYEELFTSEEYLRIQRGLENEEEDILCRTCAEGREV